jgi:hypothetical protein
MADQPDFFRITNQEGEPTYEFDLKRVHVDLFHLLSIFLADEKIAYILSGVKDPLWNLCSVAESEIARILVTSATIARISDEHHDFELLRAEDQCGTLREDITSEKFQSLTLREACNKIIHAKEIDFDIKRSTKEFYSIDPVVYLLGEKGNKSWEARLDIVQYVRSYMNRIRKVMKSSHSVSRKDKKIKKRNKPKKAQK